MLVPSLLARFSPFDRKWSASYLITNSVCRLFISLYLLVPPINEQDMDLGALSVSLTVKKLKASQQLDEKLGFQLFSSKAVPDWLILKNGKHIIGLFRGMFDRNILSCNPDWDSNAQKPPAFTAVRDLSRGKERNWQRKPRKTQLVQPVAL